MNRSSGMAVVLGALALGCQPDGQPGNGNARDAAASLIDTGRPEAAIEAGPDVDVGPGETPGAGPGADAAPGAGCACQQAGPDIATTLECYCQSGGDCAEGRGLGALLAEAAQAFGCHQVRDYAGCGLKALARRTGFDPRHHLWVFAVASDELVGVRATADLPVTCPSVVGARQGRDLLAGKVPGTPTVTGCSETACQEICDGSPLPSCTPDQE